jgi:hypothetical protein
MAEQFSLWHEYDPYRACYLCKSGSRMGWKERECTNHNVVGTRKKPVMVEQARKHGGACGPEAEHLNFPGLKSTSTSTE